MAWITKNSAGDTVQRRDEPYLTQEMADTLAKEFLPRFKTRTAALLPALHMIQHAYGWVPRQAMLEIAEALEIPPADVFDTASFYEEYWLHPKGTTLISVCRSIACEFCGSRAVTEAACAKLGIEVGETTEDGAFTIIELECLGSCGSAPAVLINEDLHENLTPDTLTELIDQVKNNTYQAGGKDHGPNTWHGTGPTVNGKPVEAAAEGETAEG